MKKYEVKYTYRTHSGKHQYSFTDYVIAEKEFTKEEYLKYKQAHCLSNSEKKLITIDSIKFMYHISKKQMPKKRGPIVW